MPADAVPGSTILRGHPKQRCSCRTAAGSGARWSGSARTGTAAGAWACAGTPPPRSASGKASSYLIVGTYAGKKA